MYGDVTINYAFGMPGMGELIVILIIVLLLFGAKRIPEMARGIGSGIREFKKAASGELDEDDKKSAKSASGEDDKK